MAEVTNTLESAHEVALTLARPLVTKAIESSISRVEDIVDDGERVEQPNHEVKVVVGLCYRLDFVGSVASEPRPNPLIAIEILLEEVWRPSTSLRSAWASWVAWSR